MFLPLPLYNVHSMRAGTETFNLAGAPSMNAQSKNVQLFSVMYSPMHCVLGYDLVDRKGCRGEAARK